MKQVESESDFRQLVRGHYDELPPQQQLVAQYLLDELPEIPFLSVPELAKRCGASEATIVRLAQSLGYSGFSGLKMDLMDALRQRVAVRTAEPTVLARHPNDVESLAAVVRQEMQNLGRTSEELDREQFRRVSAALYKADHVYTFGLGISSYLAELLGYLLAQIGLRSTTLSTRFSSPLEQLVPLRPTDLLVVFSFPPYSRPTIEMLRETAGRGLPTVAICDQLTSPAAGIARHALAVRSDNLLFTNSFAAVSMVLNALVTEIAVRHQDHSLEAVSRINRILEQDRDLIEDSR